MGAFRMDDISIPFLVRSASRACRDAKCFYMASVAFRRAVARLKVDGSGLSVGRQKRGSVSKPKRVQNNPQRPWESIIASIAVCNASSLSRSGAFS